MSTAILKTARQILDTEARAIQRLSRRLGKNFEKALALMVSCKGRVIVTGMGKPGFIGRKIAATLASTGTPSMFLHPAEALHGDLGMVTKEDLMIAISNSGESEEVVRLLPTLKKIGVALVAMTSSAKSPLARNADVVLDLGVTREACPLNLAPSTSTTAALAMGDALALSLLKKKGFREEDFALLHPGGSLGRKLLKVRDLMRRGRESVIVRENVPLKKVLLMITRARAGSCTVVDAKRRLRGIFTDGDLRRHLRTGGEGILKKAVSEVATARPASIRDDRLAAEALHVLRTRRIDELPVVDAAGRVVGLLDVQDLLKAGFV